MKVFVDSNIPMYVAGKEHPHREAARRLLAKIQRGQIEGFTSVEVLQEILYRYTALQKSDLAQEVYDAFVQICPVVLGVSGVNYFFGLTTTISLYQRQLPFSS